MGRYLRLGQELPPPYSPYGITAIPEGYVLDPTMPPAATCATGSSFRIEARLATDGSKRVLYHGACVADAGGAVEAVAPAPSQIVVYEPSTGKTTTAPAPTQPTQTVYVPPTETTTPAPTTTTAPQWWDNLLSTPWLNEELIAGVPNKWLLLGLGAFLLFFADSGKGRR